MISTWTETITEISDECYTAILGHDTTTCVNYDEQVYQVVDTGDLRVLVWEDDNGQAQMSIESKDIND